MWAGLVVRMKREVVKIVIGKPTNNRHSLTQIMDMNKLFEWNLKKV